MTVFFDVRGVVHYEFLSTRQTVNKEYYLSIMRRLQKQFVQKDQNYGPTILGLCSLTLHSFFVTNLTLVKHLPKLIK